MSAAKMIKKYLPMTESAFLILFSLQEPKHGYRIMGEVTASTNSRVTVGAGTMYGTLSKMEADGLISFQQEEDLKKIYKITDLGEKVLAAEESRLLELAHLINQKRSD